MHGSDHWERHAIDWRHFGSPLRPSPEDVVWMERALLSATPAPKALMLGVTPELAAMRWPIGTRLMAVDRCPAMIRHVWPRDHVPPGAVALRGAWNLLPLVDGVLDVVVGDGIDTLIAFPHEADALFAEVRRVLRPDGLFLLRAFVRPLQGESLDAVHDDLAAGRIGSFHAYKWRLAMALHGALAEGVLPAEIWRAWRECVPDPAVLVRQTGWPPEAVATIDAYRESPARYSFPTLDELTQALGRHFVVTVPHLPGYELGERCPLFALRPLA